MSMIVVRDDHYAIGVKLSEKSMALFVRKQQKSNDKKSDMNSDVGYALLTLGYLVQ